MISTVETLHEDLKSGWRTKLLAIQGIPDQWSWEGKHYSPVTGRAYIRESFRPVITRRRGVGTAGIEEHRINGGLDLVFPSGKGTGDVDAAAGKILKALPVGGSIAHGDHAAGIITSERGGAVIAPDWITVPITITFLAHTST